MTLRQEAYQLINALPEDSVQAVIQIMVRMIPQTAATERAASDAEIKRQAYQDLQVLRKQAALFDFSEENRAEALAEKFGELG